MACLVISPHKEMALPLRTITSLSLALLCFSRFVCADPLPDIAEKGDYSSLVAHIDIQADVNEQQPDGMTALHWAVQHSDAAMVRALLTAGAVPDIKNAFGVHPLAIAATNGNTEIARLLLKAGVNVNDTLAGGETALMTAARVGNPELTALLIDKGADLSVTVQDRQNAVSWAAAAGNIQVVKQLIRAGADYRFTPEDGFSPFFFAVREGHRDIVEYFIGLGIDASEPMSVKKAGPKQPKNGTTALTLAVENGHYALAIDLVDAGADPNDLTSPLAPLHRIVGLRRPDKGDGARTMPPKGSGPLESLDFVDALVERGADVNLRLVTGRTAQGVLTNKGATALLMAAEKGDIALMKRLISFGADPHLGNVDKATPLLAAAGLGSLRPSEEAGTESDALAAVELLIDLGADINHVDENGENILHAAAYGSYPMIVRHLNKMKLKTTYWSAKNEYGRTPLLIAQGYRPGNFMPSHLTEEAIAESMKGNGLEPDMEPNATLQNHYE